MEKGPSFVFGDARSAELCASLAREGRAVWFAHTCGEGGVSVDGCTLRAINEIGAPEIASAVVDAAEAMQGLDELIFDARSDPEDSDRYVLDLDEVSWLEADARGPRAFFLCAKYALPYLISSSAGRIIVLRGEHGAEDVVQRAARAALDAAVEHIRREFAVFGVAVEERR